MRRISTALAGAGLAFSLMLPSLAQAGLTTMSDLVVIGDSLSDGGNSGLVSQAAAGFVFPPFPYAGGRYSNGPTAVEQLWNLYNPGQPFLPSLAGGTNFAIGGATTGTENFNEVNGSVPDGLKPAYADLGTAWQLDRLAQYVGANGPFDPATTLFYVGIFPNDVFYAGATGMLPGTVPGSPGGGNVIENGIANIVTTVATLAQGFGAQHILVANMPDLGLTPEFSGDPNAADLSLLTALFNAGLAQQLTLLDAILPAEIMQFDTAAAVNSILANPAAYGFTNVADQCVENIQNGQCNPFDNRYLFWDGVHPTTYGHSVVAGMLRAQLVPEPGSLALLSLALAGVALATRRRR